MKSTNSAHKKTDKIISDNFNKSKSNYYNAYKKIRKSVIDEFAKIEITPTMTSQEKINEINKYGRFDKITELLTDNIANINKSEIIETNNTAKDIYKLNYDYMAKQFGENKIDKNETNKELKENANPYNDIAIDSIKDKAEIKRTASNNLLDAMIKGATLSSVLMIVRKLYEKNFNSLQKIFETNATRVENMAILNVLNKNKDKVEGQTIVKVWRTVGDSKVRDAHARANGQEAEIDKPFYVGGEKLMYPGDPNGSIGNIIRCRCFIEYKYVKIS